ncbi:NAD(P)-dependent oxidoreductase [Methanococcoides orientis]|uniref:NAD-dependent epimerase/dehydratase family protein n=1 Tax=Methanococcoides orientis TaxID=2822137 RepID=UPI001E59DF69|nr:NAD(P)-dependent oxidoreductase [Methanococcoides orientis]UGV40297.1 NAD(P)-dependent oxidoreductase [Methanococcoides orientis]
MSKKVVVFGGSGFLGSHIADALTQSGYQVRIFDIKTSPYLKAGQEMFIGDILNKESVENAVDGCDVVYNLAGIADIDECVRRPIDTIRYNILGNAMVLEAAKNAGVERFIFSSSVYVYSQTGSFYRSSKQSAESFIEDYNKLFDLPYTILRYGSLYGNRADDRNSIYRLIKEALTTKKIEYHGTGEEIREYIHVEDAARSSVEVLDPEYENQHVILTGNQTLKYKDLLNMVNEMSGGDVEIIYENSKSETHYQVTPYSFNPRIGRKLTSNYYVDMGQGLLSIMSEIFASIHKEVHEEMGYLIEDGMKNE